MREITLFLHSQKISQPEPVLAKAFSRLARMLRPILSQHFGHRSATR